MNKFDPVVYLSSLNIDVMHFGLKAVSRLLSRFGNPQDSYKTILIAGTNGKGSTAAMAASILHSAGYKTGLYTSPHLIDVKERIAINGRKIPAQDFHRIIAAVRKEIDQPVTYFEVLTAAALLYFQRRKIDIAVLEVGLGGRLDATNVCRPLVSVITNIGLEHTAYLGNTLAAIAGEKAGIIKQNGVCITAAKQKSVLEVLENICRRRKARLYRLGRDIGMERQTDGTFIYRGVYGSINNLSVPLGGAHQADNAALALAAIEIAAKNGFSISAAAINKGLKKTHWEARLEILHDDPLFVVDGAHNPDGMNVLCKALKNDFSYHRLILIFSALADKDYRRMFRKIAPLAQQIIFTQLQTKRAVPVEEIYEYAKKAGYAAIVTKNAADSVGLALKMAAKKDLVCAAGSLYLAGEIKQAFPAMASCDKKPKLK